MSITVCTYAPGWSSFVLAAGVGCVRPAEQEAHPPVCRCGKTGQAVTGACCRPCQLWPLYVCTWYVAWYRIVVVLCGHADCDTQCSVLFGEAWRGSMSR